MPITRVICFCCLLKCFRSILVKQWDPDQTAPRSSLILDHTVCLFTKVITFIKMWLKIAVDDFKQMSYSDADILTGTLRTKSYFVSEISIKVEQVESWIVFNGVARTLKKLRTSNGDYWINQWFSSIASLFKMGTSLKGKNLLPGGANSFL